MCRKSAIVSINKPEPSHSSLRSDPAQVPRNNCLSPAGMSAQVEWNPQAWARNRIGGLAGRVRMEQQMEVEMYIRRVLLGAFVVGFLMMNLSCSALAWSRRRDQSVAARRTVQESQCDEFPDATR